MLLSGAEIVIEELVRHGVDTVFGYPGGYVIDIYDELYKNKHRITHILTAHEQGAAHAADAYARVSGKVGAVIATSGPGATNLVTGIANAYLDSVPVVFITGNVPVPLLGGDSFQELDIVGVTLPIIKHSYIIKHISDLQHALREAFLISCTGRKGPVLVDIPKCVQVDKCEYDPSMDVSPSASTSIHASTSPAASPSASLSASPPTSPSAFVSASSSTSSVSPPVLNSRPLALRDLNAILDAINKSSRPYIYCGGGVASVGEGARVVALSKKIDAPVGMSMMGIGAVPYSYELNLGMCGMHGKYASTVAMSEADLIIALGVRFADRATGNARRYAENSKIIHVDIDAAEIGKNVKADFSLCGDLRDILPILIDNIHTRSNGPWLDRINELKLKSYGSPSNDFTPMNIIDCVNKLYDDDVVVTTDVGQHQMWVAQYYRFEKPRKLITSGGLGAMGFGLGAAVGASIARGRKRVVLFTGDGSLGMNLTEMATVVTEKLPITIVLLNNGVLGMVRQWQALFFEKRYSCTEPERKTDFPALAKAFGIAGYAADTLGSLDNILKNIPENESCLIDCKIGADERVLPMIPAGGTVRDILLA